MILVLHNAQLGSIAASNADDPTNAVRIFLGANYIPTADFERVAPSLKVFLDNFKKHPTGDKGPAIQVFRGKVKTKEKNKDGKEVEKEVEKYLEIDDLELSDVTTVVENIMGAGTGNVILEHTYKEANKNLVSKRLFEIDKQLAEREKANKH